VIASADDDDDDDDKPRPAPCNAACQAKKRAAELARRRAIICQRNPKAAGCPKAPSNPPKRDDDDDDGETGCLSLKMHCVLLHYHAKL
jgi:hypothetical protein